MKWEKLGQILRPQSFPFLGGYAANPFAIKKQHSIFEVFFNYRDENHRSFISSFEIDLLNPKKLLREPSAALLSPGQVGLFDDNGVSLSCIVNKGEQLFLYYLGWNLCKSVPWRNSIGLALSEDGGRSFKKFSKAPIVDRSEIDPYSISYPYVMQDNGLWRMWYGTNRNWGPNQEDMDHVIKYAESRDGKTWNRLDKVAIDHKDESEYAISKPSIICHRETYFMWYSYRGDQYKLGLAMSKDGIDWVRIDEKVGIDISPDTDWDNHSICYPHIIEHQENLYMLYVGNHYGKGGLGLAKMPKESLLNFNM